MLEKLMGWLGYEKKDRRGNYDRSPEARKRMSEAMKKHWNRKTYSKQRKAMRKHWAMMRAQGVNGKLVSREQLAVATQIQPQEEPNGSQGN